MSDAIHTDEWLAELQRLSARSDEGQSLAELSEAAGVADKTMLVRIKKAMKMGWVTVGRRAATSVIGRGCWTPVYRIEVPRDSG